MRKGKGAPLRALRGIQRSAPAPRQDHRRDCARPTGNPRYLPTPSARKWGGGASFADPRRHSEPRARGRGRCGGVLGVYGNRRQPRLHAEPARGRRSSRWCDRVSHRGDRARPGCRRSSRAMRGLRPRRGYRDQCCGACGPGHGGSTWGQPCGLLRQGPLLHAVREVTVSAPGLPGGPARRTRCARDPGSCRTGQIRTRRGLAG